MDVSRKRTNFYESRNKYKLIRVLFEEHSLKPIKSAKGSLLLSTSKKVHNTVQIFLTLHLAREKK